MKPAVKREWWKEATDPGSRAPSVKPLPMQHIDRGGPWELYYDERFGTTMQPIVVYGDGSHHETLYALQPKQVVTYRKTPLFKGTPSAKHIGYGGAAGGGKSYLARATAAGVAHKWPGSTSIIFRKTRDEVIENHVKPFREEVPGALYDLNMQRLEVYWKATGSYTLFGYLGREDHVYRYQGNSYDCMIFEEATHYTWWMVNWLTGNRLRANVDGADPFALYPSNPGNVGHFWFKRLFVTRDHHYDPELPREEWEEDPDNYAFVQAYLEDNKVLMERDPAYVRQLNTLPEPERSWLKDGDWEAGAGLALPELSRRVHMTDVFTPPEHWPWFASFDWGFEHPWVMGIWTINEDGVLYLVDSFFGRRDTAPQIASKAAELMDEKPYIAVRPEDLVSVQAGHDTFHTQRSRGDDTPHRAEALIDEGFPVRKANIDRIHGLNTLREYLAWQNQGPDGGPGEPAFYIFDTPGNQRTMGCLESMTTDPDNPEDALKREADEFGEGGDDPYDMVRYGVASRPSRPSSTFTERDPRAWDRDVLEAEHERGRKGGHRARDRRTESSKKPSHPVFGRAY